MPLDEAECLQLLGTAHLGRVALTIGALPVIRPVRFVLHNGQVVFRARSDSRLRTAAADQVIAFEADYDSPEAAAGWTVHAFGLCQEIREPLERSRLESLPLPAWERGAPDVFLLLGLERISGARVYW